MSVGSPESDDVLERPCPGCGYDLRATVEARCPECGTAFDVAASEVSRIPWLARGKIGVVRAVAGTVWLSFRRPGSMFAETVRPADDREARRYQLTVTVAPAIAVGAAAACAARSLLPEGVKEQYLTDGQVAAKWLDLWLPIVVGPLWLKVGVAAALLTVLLPLASTAPFVLLRREGRLSERAARTAALTRYGSGGVALISGGAALAAYCVAVFANATGRGLKVASLEAGMAVGAAAALTGMWAMAGTPLRLMWRCGAGLGRTLAGAGMLAAQYAVHVATAAMLGMWLPGYLVMAWRAWRWP